MAAIDRVLFVAPELFPYAKTGGLGDVSAALPPALREAGVDCRLLVPGYQSILDNVALKTVVRGLRLIPAVRRPASILSGRLPDGTPVYVLRCPALFERDGGPYQDASGMDWPDNTERFALLGAAAAMLCNDETPLKWHPTVMHINDWQAGLGAAFRAYDDRPGARVLASVHNLSFAGEFTHPSVTELGLPAWSYSPNGLEFYGRGSFLKAALFFADHITTVSPTYADEITTPAFGGGFEGLLDSRRHGLTGILNGIDSNVWNPKTDPHLAKTYGSSSLEQKSVNKRELRERLKLNPNNDQPLAGVVSRLTWQKGIDLVAECAPRWLAQGIQVAIVGTGEQALEARLRGLAERFPGQMGVFIGYDEPLSHLMEAGLDMFLMPSRFEPCGLNQMYSMAYGTPPVVRKTGGLADSVVDERSGEVATGFVFDQGYASDLDQTMQHAVSIWQDPSRWRALQRYGMAADFSWPKSALAYKTLYAELRNRGPR